MNRPTFAIESLEITKEIAINPLNWFLGFLAFSISMGGIIFLFAALGAAL